jgi:hypothetical protein
MRSKVNLAMCLFNEAPRQEDVWGSEGMIPPLLTLAVDGV